MKAISTPEMESDDLRALASELPTLPVEILDPEALAPLTAQGVQQLMAEGASANTQASYRAAQRYWAAWYALRYRRPLALPVPVPVVLQYLIDHVQRQRPGGRLVHDLPEVIDRALVAGGFKSKLGPPALNTVIHRLAVLSKTHATKALTNPLKDPAVVDLLAQVRRAYAKRGVRPRRQDALAKPELEQLATTCDDSLRGLRDRALLLFAWASGGRRRSEVTRATLENTRRIGPGEWRYTLSYSKTNQAGIERPENDKPIVGIAAAALEAWIAASGITAGPIFRRIRRDDRLGGGLDPQSVRAIVRHRSQLAGLIGDFSAHSLRSGFITEAGRQNLPLGETMALTGHTSVTTVMKYFRSAGALGRGAKLLDDGHN